MESSVKNLSVSQFSKLPSSVNGFGFDGGAVVPSLEQSPDSYAFAPLYNVNNELDFPDDHEPYPVLKFINQILMEEKEEEQPSNHHDLLALRAAEESFYEVLRENYPPSTHQPSVGSSDQSSESFYRSTKISSQNGTNDRITAIDRQQIHDYQKTSGKQIRASDELNPLQNSNKNRDRQVGSFTDPGQISSMFDDSEITLQLKRGFEEGSKFLPASNPFKIDLEKYSIPSTDLANDATGLVAEGKKDGAENPVNHVKGRKHEYQHDNNLDGGRSSKQSAVSMQEVELSAILERALLDGDGTGTNLYDDFYVKLQSKSDKIQKKDGSLRRTRAGKHSGKKPGTSTETFDLSTVLTSCSQSIAAADYRTAKELLKVIRKHASSTGDAHQRLAFLFANALEARMMGTGAELYAALASKRVSFLDELRACRVYLCAPFRQMYSFFTTKMTLEAASKATTLHIVDFGIKFGFNWAGLIKQLSIRPGGPPKLRITGIELPQPGFRPAEIVEETGRRLAKFCERFHVPFEYQGMAVRNWETIKIEDLNLTRSEVLAVNSQFQFKSLLDEDEAAEDRSPRDAVLSLIREMKPDIFLSDVLNGPLCSPFFITRFREALIYFSTIFDMLDANLRREDPQRYVFEQELFGAEVMSVIACEGSARVERYETYKQWQVRYERAGFLPLPLNQDFVKELRSKVKEGYHKDFMFDENGYWILQGWKGKIITASSCWIPS